MEFGSVSQLIAQAKAGDDVALAGLHQRYWPKLVDLARRRIQGAPLHDCDAEDVAQIAFISFYNSLKHKRLPNLEHRHQLLALLSHIVLCKAINEIKRSVTQRQGGGEVLNLAALAELAKDDRHTPLEQALLKDCYEFYMHALSEPLRPFAELHLAGLTNLEIAERMNCVERTVERKVALLRLRWTELAQNNLDRDIDEVLRPSTALPTS